MFDPIEKGKTKCQPPLRLRGEEEALSAAGWMTLGPLIDLDQELAIQATGLSIENKLPMADSLILATAQKFQATLWTQDEHVDGLPGVRYIAKAV